MSFQSGEKKRDFKTYHRAIRFVEGVWVKSICDVNPSLDYYVVFNWFGSSTVRKGRRASVAPHTCYGKSDKIIKYMKKWGAIVKLRCDLWESTKHSEVCAACVTDENCYCSSRFVRQLLQPFQLWSRGWKVRGFMKDIQLFQLTSISWDSNLYFNVMCISITYNRKFSIASCNGKSRESLIDDLSTKCP